MADLSVTAANVRRGAEYVETTGTSGEAITVGQLVAEDTSDGKLYLADCDSGTTQRRKITGVALSATSAVDQKVTYVSGGYVNPGAAVTSGEIYVLSGTAGAICPEGDLASGDTVSILGVGYSSSLIRLSIFNSEAVV